jgi:hypothetical protein
MGADKNGGPGGPPSDRYLRLQTLSKNLSEQEHQNKEHARAYREPPKASTAILDLLNLDFVAHLRLHLMGPRSGDTDPRGARATRMPRNARLRFGGSGNLWTGWGHHANGQQQADCKWQRGCARRVAPMGLLAPSLGTVAPNR